MEICSFKLLLGSAQPYAQAVNNRRGVARALLAAPLLTAAFAVVAAGLPAAATAATAHSASSAPAARPAAPAASLLTSALATGTGTRAGSAVMGSISGIVRGATGAALPGVCVTATGPAAGSAMAGPTAAHHVVTTADGRYVVRDLRPGAYTVSYSDCARPGRYLAQSYGETGVTAGPARVTVKAGHPALLSPMTLRLASPLAAVAASRRAQAAERATETPRARAGQAAARQDVISGTARTKSGRALAGICVFAQTSTANSVSGFAMQTGRHGGYQLPIGTSGKYQVEFSGDCGNRGNFAPQWWRYAPTERKATNLRARPGRNFRGINAALLPGAEITGTVRAAGSGKPLKGVCVSAAGGSDSSALDFLSSQVVTRTDGTYVLKNLGTGRYRIQFSPGCGLGGNYLNSSYPRAVSAKDGKTVHGINGSLRLGGEIRGEVTSQATGAALAGICVNVQNASETSFFAAVSGKTGTYSVGQLPPGRYQVQFQPGCGNSGNYQTEYYKGTVNPAGATVVAVTGGKVRSGIDAAMLAAGTLSGRVTNQAGAPVPGACVQVSSQNAAGGFGGLNLNLSLALLATGSSSFELVTGPKGGYSIGGLVPGLYSVEFSGGCGHGSDIYAGHAFTPQGGQGSGFVAVRSGVATTGVSAVLRPGGSIAGLVTGRSGKRLSGSCVSAVPAGTPPATASLLLNAVPTSHGSYKIPGLAAGKYAVQFGECLSGPYASQWYKNKRTQGTANLVTVRTGHTTAGISARLVSGGTITGRVLSAVTGKPVAHACVILETLGGALANAVLTSKTGQYTLTHVAAGRWAVDPSQCLSSSPALAAISRAGVMVRNGRATTESFRLPAAGRISGTVTGGMPATAQAGVCVEATPISGDGLPNATVTNAQGHYTLPGLAAGRYRVLLTSLCPAGTSALVPQWFNGQPTSGAATPVSVAAGKTTKDIDGSLVADGGISGTVTGSSAAAVAGVCVGAYAGTSTTPAAIAITGVAGGYQLPSLRPGTYTVEFSSGCGAASYATQWFSGATARSGASPVTVTAGVVTGDINAG